MARDSIPAILIRKPAGKLLPGAHQIDREYQVMAALGASGVPVPRMIAYCENPEVIYTRNLLGWLRLGCFKIP